MCPSPPGGYVDSPPIRIAFASHVFWPERRRGGERLIRDLADALLAQGDSVRLITSHRGRPARRVEAGLEVVRQWRPPERPFNRLGLPPGSSHALPAWWALRHGGDDVVQGWTAPAALAAAYSGKPSVYVFQGVLHEDDFAGRPRVRALVERAARACDAVTTYSDVAAREFERLAGVSAQPIEPGIRLDAFTPGGERSPRPVIFCAADPDEARKRVPLLVDAFAQVRAQVPAAELWLMATRHASLAAAAGVRIVEPGADQDALVRLYRSAWVTVLPAFREAFGLVVAESLACGTPVIGMSDGGAVPELVGADDQRTGRIAEPAVDALAAALLAALAAPPDAPAVAACRARSKDFSIERCAARYRALYSELA